MGEEEALGDSNGERGQSGKCGREYFHCAAMEDYGVALGKLLHCDSKKGCIVVNAKLCMYAGG